MEKTPFSNKEVILRHPLWDTNHTLNMYLRFLLKIPISKCKFSIFCSTFGGGAPSNRLGSDYRDWKRNFTIEQIPKFGLIFRIKIIKF